MQYKIKSLKIIVKFYMILKIRYKLRVNYLIVKLLRKKKDMSLYSKINNGK